MHESLADGMLDEMEDPIKGVEVRRKVNGSQRRRKKEEKMDYGGEGAAEEEEFCIPHVVRKRWEQVGDFEGTTVQEGIKWEEMEDERRKMEIGIRKDWKNGKQVGREMQRPE